MVEVVNIPRKVKWDPPGRRAVQRTTNCPSKSRPAPAVSIAHVNIASPQANAAVRRMNNYALLGDVGAFVGICMAGYARTPDITNAR
jgi:hypothetical protein